MHQLILILLACSPTWDDPISVQQAKDHVGKTVTLKLTVKSANFLKAKDICFLNSNKNHRDKDNFTIVFKKDGLAAFKENKVGDPASHFKNKTIVVSGKIETYRDKLQIVVETFEQVKTESEDDDS